VFGVKKLSRYYVHEIEGGQCKNGVLTSSFLECSSKLRLLNKTSRRKILSTRRNRNSSSYKQKATRQPGFIIQNCTER